MTIFARARRLDSEDIGNEGERLSRDAPNSSAVHHPHRYAVAISLCHGKRVADIASGEGYGSNLIAGRAEHVTGVDISERAVRHAASAYPRRNLEFLVGSASQIPLSDTSVDVVTSFETIEHHDKHEEMIREFKRISKPGGLLVISSPDKRYYSDLPGFHNPHHVKELYEDDFKRLIGAHFNNLHLYGQKIAGGSLVFSKEAQRAEFSVISGDFDHLTEATGVSGAQYIICLASDSALPTLPASFFDGELIAEARRQGEMLLNDMRKSVSFKVGSTMTAPLRWLHKRLGR
jgi:SAM-dependent methyltransferase